MSTWTTCSEHYLCPEGAHPQAATSATSPQAPCGHTICTPGRPCHFTGRTYAPTRPEAADTIADVARTMADAVEHRVTATPSQWATMAAAAVAHLAPVAQQLEAVAPFDLDPAGRLLVTTDTGRPWAVRIVRPGDTYGRTGAFTVRDAPLVEFYDLANPATFGTTGQFVSRYGADTLLGRAPFDGCRIGETSGLDLDTGIPEWSLDRATCAHVAAWLESALPDTDPTPAPEHAGATA